MVVVVRNERVGMGVFQEGEEAEMMEVVLGRRRAKVNVRSMVTRSDVCRGWVGV